MNIDVVKILGYGLSGLGFLLMYLAYRLLSKLSDQPSPSPLIVSSIKYYIVVCLLMTVVVGAFTFINKDYKNNLLSLQAKQIQNKNNSIAILSNSQKNSVLSDSLSYYAKAGNKVKTESFAIEQKKTLDTISSHIIKLNDPALISKFANYKNFMFGFATNAVMLNYNKQDSIFSTYKNYSDSVSRISLKAVTSQK